MSFFRFICCTSNRGAVVVEYVLLLVACVAIAGYITGGFKIDNDFGQSGWLIQTWWETIRIIAEDI